MRQTNPMAEAFTPGPWEINPVKTVDGEFMVCNGAKGHAYGLVAVVVTEADARLVASAPDLLKAAQRALNVLKATGESVRPGNALGALDVAIRKATGEL